MSPQLNVLILEDRLADVDLLTRALRQAGLAFTWQQVDTRADYLAHLNPTIDIILADYQLPGFDAVTALQLLKEQNLDIPLIVVTGALTEEVAMACIKQGAADYLLKDRLVRLGEAIKQALEQKKLRQQKQEAEIALRDSEKRFRTIFESAPIGLIVTECNGKFLQTNRTLQEMLGYSEAELQEMTFKDIIYSADLAESMNLSAQLLQQQVNYHHFRQERRYQSKTGQLVWTDTIVFVIFEAEGKFQYISLIEDITKQKQVEIELKQHAAQLALINVIGSEITALQELDELLHRAARLVQQLFDYHHVALFLVENDRLKQKAVAGSYQPLFPPGHSQALTLGINGWVASHGEILVANDVSVEPRYISLMSGPSATQSELCLPIKVRGQTVGVLDIQSPHRNTFSHNDIIAMEALTHQIATAVQNAKLYQQAQQEIAERRQAEDALRQSETKNRALLKAIPDLMFRYSHDGTYLEYKEGSEADLYLPPGQFLGKKINDVLPPEVAELTMQAITHTLKTGTMHVFEYRLTQNGRTVDYEARIVVSDEAEVLAIIRDISDRKQAEDEIFRLFQAERNRFYEAEALRQAALALASTIDLDQVIERSLAELQNVVPFTSASIQILQSNELKIIGGHGFSNLSELIGFTFPIHAEIPNKTVLESQQPMIIDDVLLEYAPSFTLPPHNPMNTRSWMGIPLVKGEQIIGMLSLDNQQPNFYSQAHAQVALTYAAQAAIAIENARLHAETKQHAQQLAVLHELDRAIATSLHINELYFSFAKHTKHLVGFDCMSISLVKDDQLYIAFAIGAAQTSTGMTFSLKDTRVYQIVAQGQPIVHNSLGASGRYIEEEELVAQGIQSMMIIPLKIKRQTFGAWSVGSQQVSAYSLDSLEIAQSMADQLAIAIDNAQLYEQAQQEIVERKQAQQALEAERISLAQRVEERTMELQAANAELARAARLKDEFLASMSHELRTPLNAVLGMAETLSEEIYGSLNEKQLKSVRTVEESGRHLLSLINDILDLSKIEAGKLTLESNPISIQSVCYASLQFVKQMAHNKQIKLTSDYDSPMIGLQADELRLKQILVNLLSNAVKFTHSGGEVGLEVRGDPAQQIVYFTVWDTGIGISKADMARLFQPFVQLDSRLSREYSGTGLGLSLVYRLTEMHGGSVSIESQPGQGSRFTVSLPWRKTEDPGPTQPLDVLELAATLQGSPPESKTSSDKSVLVLLAEDNQANIDAMAGYLSIKGYQVIVARNGAEAIERAEADRPAIVLMDIQMPQVDGIEAIRRLRANPDLATIPIIALTALAMPGDRERCLAAGANEYLSKPVRLKQLAETIAAQLSG